MVWSLEQVVWAPVCRRNLLELEEINFFSLLDSLGHTSITEGGQDSRWWVSARTVSSQWHFFSGTYLITQFFFKRDDFPMEISISVESLSFWLAGVARYHLNSG